MQNFLAGLDRKLGRLAGLLAFFGALGVVVLLGGSLAIGQFFPHLGSMGVWIAATAYTMLQGLILYARWKAGTWEGTHLYQRDVERIVNTIFEEVTGAMSRGDRVELRGFGAFSVKKRDARVGRNPRTGETVHVEEKHVPFFKTGKLLRDRLNGKA